MTQITAILVLVFAVSSSALPSRRTATRRSFFTPKRSKSGSSCRGTCLVFRRPTAQSTSKLFDTTKASYNHLMAGMTNPSLHISVGNEVVLEISTNRSNKKGWFPDTLAENTAKCWKKLEFRRRVGFGLACYEAVRDSMLVWDFEKDNRGIVSVDTNSAISRPSLLRQTHSHCGYDVVHTGSVDSPQNWHSTPSALSIGDCQSLATYSKVGPFWFVNPVKVVYDIVDQRGPASTYSSTAYATMRGHWLAGEERMTVALRDDGQVDLQLVSFSRPNKIWTRLAWPIIGNMQKRFFTSQMDWLQQVATDKYCHEQDCCHPVAIPLVSKPVPVPLPEPLSKLPAR